jgi:hypothetical protein
MVTFEDDDVIADDLHRLKFDFLEFEGNLLLGFGASIENGDFSQLVLDDIIHDRRLDFFSQSVLADLKHRFQSLRFAA